jgi:hypothetical protein
MKDDPGAEEAFFGAKVKHSEKVMNHSKVSFSVMYCVNGAGWMLPPMVIYKSANSTVYIKWCQGGPPGCVYAATRSGWFDMPKFNQWFTEGSFLSWCTVPVPVWYGNIP